jgi:hypothetical protein
MAYLPGPLAWLGQNGVPNLKVSVPKLKFRCFGLAGLTVGMKFLFEISSSFVGILARNFEGVQFSLSSQSFLHIMCKNIDTIRRINEIKILSWSWQGLTVARILFLKYLRHLLKFLQETLRASKAITVSQSLSHIMCKNCRKICRSSETKISWFEFGRDYCGRDFSF